MERTSQKTAPAKSDAQRRSHLTKTRSVDKSATSDRTPLSLPARGLNPLDSSQSPNQILPLQRTLGNRAVGRAIQAKLTIGRPDDEYEREADRVADTVMKMPKPQQGEEENPEVQAKPIVPHITPLVQRQAEDEEDMQMKPVVQRRVDEGDEEETVQTKPADVQRLCPECEEKMQRQPKAGEDESLQAKAASSGGTQASVGVAANISAMKGGGQPLPDRARDFFESRFGADFGKVRIHNDIRAAETSKSINAKAFTAGSDIAFAAGQYSPESSSGKSLLAHELTHVVQQSDGKPLEARSVSRKSGSTAVGKSKVISQSERVVQRQPTERNVNDSITETISNAPPPYGAWNGTFSWQSRFTLTIDPTAHTLVVSVRIFSSATRRQKQAWENAIEGKWSNRYDLVVAGATAAVPAVRYPITIDLQWVSSFAPSTLYRDTILSGSTSGGRAGQGGTTSMTDWGTSDAVDITHEFGHMLGNPEEYFTTDGNDYTRGGTRRGFRDPGGGVMNNPGDDPFTRHYELIRGHAARALGVPESRCTVQAHVP